MKLNLVKQLNGTFKPAYDSDYEKSKRYKVGDVLDVDIKKPRNLKFHKKFFALMNMVYQNQPEGKEINNFDHFRKYLIKRAGFFETIETPTGTIYEADSISFASMDEVKFNDLYSRVVDTIVKIYGWEESDILENLEDFY